jgi:hypothetical protein
MGSHGGPEHTDLFSRINPKERGDNAFASAATVARDSVADIINIPATEWRATKPFPY